MLQEFKTDIPVKRLFALTVFIYILIDTRYNIPLNLLLRWLFPGLFLLVVASKSKSGIHLFPSQSFFLMVLYFICTIIESPVKFYSFQRVISLILIVGMYYTYYSYLSKLHQLDDVLKVLGFLYVLYGIANFMFIGARDSGRAVGITSGANSLGIESNISLVFASYFYEKSNKKQKKFWIVLMLMFAAEAVASGSRMSVSILILFLFYSVFFVFSDKRVQSLFILLALALLFLPKSYFMRIPGLARFANLGLTRDELWDYALMVYRKRPWFGYGYGSVNTTTSRAVAEGLGYHSSYITILVETGRIGLVLMISVLLNVLIKGVKSWKTDKSRELRIMIFLLIEMLVSFYGESSMTSAGSIEGFFFWGVLVWVVVKSKKSVNSKRA